MNYIEWKAAVEDAGAAIYGTSQRAVAINEMRDVVAEWYPDANIKYIVENSEPIDDIEEELDEWLSQILQTCKEQKCTIDLDRKGKEKFYDMAFEILDNDPLMDTIETDDVESSKQLIAKKLWKKYMGSQGKQVFEAVGMRLMFEPSTFDEWLVTIRDMASEDNVSISNKAKFEDVAFEVLDNDSKLDEYTGDVEKAKLEIVNALWRTHKAEIDSLKAKKRFTDRLNSPKSMEEEEMSSNDVVSAGYRAMKDAYENGTLPTCPYTKGTVRCKMWNMGARKAEKEVWSNKRTPEEEEEITNKLTAAECFMKGMEAQQRGQVSNGIEMNPYEPGSMEFENWQLGYNYSRKN